MNESLISALVYGVLAAITLGSAVAVGLAREAVRGALAAALAFVGIGLLFMWMGAEFLGFIQLLVYVGAVAVLIVFVILLTRRAEDGSGPCWPSAGALIPGLIVPALLLVALAVALNRSRLPERAETSQSGMDITALGQAILTDGLLPLFLVGVLLTAALIGGVGLALAQPEEEDKP